MIKKGFLIFGIILLVSFIFYMTINNEESSEVRIRILSNSNSESDLLEKQIVKEELEKILNEVESLDTKKIEELLLKYTKGKITNEVKVSYTNSYYPAKSYDNKFIASGNYETILITIGSGKGNNFWTLLYPEYYHIEFEESNEIEYRFYFVDLFKKISSYFEN